MLGEPTTYRRRPVMDPRTRKALAWLDLGPMLVSRPRAPARRRNRGRGADRTVAAPDRWVDAAAGGQSLHGLRAVEEPAPDSVRGRAADGSLHDHRRSTRRRGRRARRAVRRPGRAPARSDAGGDRPVARARCVHLQRPQVPAAGQPQSRAGRGRSLCRIPAAPDRRGPAEGRCSCSAASPCAPSS